MLKYAENCTDLMTQGSMTQAVGCFPPGRSIEEMTEELAWHNFYFHLTYKKISADKRIAALDKVIQTVEKTIPAVLENKWHQWDDLFSNEHVTKSKISDHFCNYIEQLYQEKFGCVPKDDAETKKIVGSYMNNILSCLKRMKNDNAQLSLPYEDEKLTLGFIEKLQCQPPDYNSDYPYLRYLS